MAKPRQSALAGDPALPVPARSGTRWWVLLVGLVAALLCAPFIRTVYWLGDEGVLLDGADRMLRGSRLYADFFEFLPPGGFVITAAWFRIAGISVLSARSLAIFTIVGIACFTFLACRQASKNAPLSALLTTGWVVMSQGPWMQLNHHWFTTLFSMVAAWAAFASVEHPQRQPWWPLIAGAAAGTAVMVTSSRGALVMLAAATAFLSPRRHRADLVAYVLGSALVPAGLLLYVVRHHALAAAFDDVIRFAAEHYASIQSVPFGSSAETQNLPLKYLFPLGAVLAIALVCARDRRIYLRDRLLRLCAAFGLAGFVGCFPRPDMAHITFAAPLACPLLAYCATWLTQRWHRLYRYIIAAIVIGLCGPAARSFLSIYHGALHGEIVSTPRGGVVLVGQPGAPELLARIATAPSGDAYFFYPYIPVLSFLTAREQVSKYDIFVPEYTLPSQYRDACLSVMRRASWVVIDRRWTDFNLLKQVFPAMRGNEPQETKAFEQALDSAFELVARYGPFELRRRQASGVDEAVCDSITE